MTNKISQEPASSVNKSNIQTSFANVKLHILKMKKKGGWGGVWDWNYEPDVTDPVCPVCSLKEEQSYIVDMVHPA